VLGEKTLRKRIQSRLQKNMSEAGRETGTERKTTSYLCQSYKKSEIAMCDDSRKIKWTTVCPSGMGRSSNIFPELECFFPHETKTSLSFIIFA
jgi:hypothetical protein